MTNFTIFFTIFISIISAQNITETQVDFVPIGKDVTEKPATTRSKAVELSRKVIHNDGIKYTEIVRQTPLGGIQVAHVEGEVHEKPSILPSMPKIPNLGGLLTNFRHTLAGKRPIEPVDRLPNYHTEERFNMMPPPPPPPPNEGLLSQVHEMTGNILDSVYVFLYGNPIDFRKH